MRAGFGWRWARRTLPVVVMLSCLGVASAAPPDGTPLLILLRPEALPTKAGANGFVVAGTFFEGGAFHWMPTSGVTDIGAREAVAVSRDGKTIVGTDLDPNRIEHAAIWTGGRTWRRLGSVRPNAQPCDALLSSSYGTNEDGRVVVGLAWDGCSHARAFRWEESTGMVDLGSLTGESTRANGVSGDGRVVFGWESVGGPREGATWVDGKQEMIQGPTGPVGEAYAANRDGSLIVGGTCDYMNTTGPPAAWTWTPAAGVKCFPVVRPIWAPRYPYQALMLGTSDDGRVIGGALSFGLDSEAVVWFDGEPFMLRDYLRANGVPDAFEGWINTGFVQDVSADGRTLVGYGAGPTTFQGWVLVLPELGKK